MEKQRFAIFPVVYLILVKENNILLLRRFQTGFEDGNYSMIAGGADGNETMREAVAREAKEEAGITVDPKKLEYVLTMHVLKPSEEVVRFFFTVKEWQGEPKNMEPDKCDDLSWFPLDALPENTNEFIRLAIDCWRKGIHYAEYGWDENRKAS